jgi:hypothetical protein
MNREQMRNKLISLQQHITELQLKDNSDSEDMRKDAVGLYDKLDEFFGEKQEEE